MIPTKVRQPPDLGRRWRDDSVAAVLGAAMWQQRHTEGKRIRNREGSKVDLVGTKVTLRGKADGFRGDDAFRNQRFKLVNQIVKGPWIVKKAVGNYGACLLG